MNGDGKRTKYSQSNWPVLAENIGANEQIILQSEKISIHSVALMNCSLEHEYFELLLQVCWVLNTENFIGFGFERPCQSATFKYVNLLYCCYLTIERPMAILITLVYAHNISPFAF